MTDHKSWLWRKRSSEKTTAGADKAEPNSRGNEEEIQALLSEKAELETELRDLGDRLSSALSEIDDKDDLAKKHAKTAQEALAGWEKAEAKALSLNQELEEALKQRKTSDEKASHLDAALKECMQQLRFIREDQEHRIHDVLVKASEELEETKMFLEGKLEESGTAVAELTAENSRLNKMLLLKEQLIEDLTRQRDKAEGDVDALLTRMESMEKDCNSLRYEVRLLEKEVDIRNEEREFNRRASDAAHKQHLENVKKIAKLESECQRLRVLVRKRLPGPAALAKMKSEVDMLQRDSLGNRRRKPNSNVSAEQLDYVVDNYPESPGKKLNFLTERICMLEEENNSLRETLQKKVNELQVSRNMYEQTASRLSLVATQFEEAPKGQIVNHGRCSSMMSHDLCLPLMSDAGSDDKASCAGSCASALISELDKIATSPSKSVRISDINHFMDDFAEMEKLALVCVDKPIENSSVVEKESSFDALSEASGKELALIPSMAEAHDTIVSGKRNLPSKMSVSISKLIEILGGINLPPQDCDTSQSPSGENATFVTHKNAEAPADYMVRVFQWKTSDLAAVLQNVLRTCDDLLNGKADFEAFALELTSALEWIMNHCFSLQDVSSMKDDIKKRFGWDETRSESEVESVGLFSEAGKLSSLKEQQVFSPSSAADGSYNDMCSDMNEKGGTLKDLVRNMNSAVHDSELQPTTNHIESLRNQLQKSESTVATLQEEVEALKRSKAVIEDEFECCKMTIEDLSSQLSAVRSELDEARREIASLEAESTDKANQCQELEAKCLDLQLQLERAMEIDATEHAGEDEKQLRNERELEAASEKLAECQETILNLGKQLKALASSREAVVSDKFVSATSPPSEKKLTNQRSSLLDQMQAEDCAEAGHLESPETKEIICPKDFAPEPVKPRITGSGSKRYVGEFGVGPLAIVPSKKKQTTSGGLLKKLLWRRKRNSSKKVTLPFAA